jgi:hypothetical protein
MGLMMLKREPPETITRRWSGYMVEIVPMSRAVIEISLSYPRSTVRNMKALIAGGGVKMAAHCATLAASRHAWIMSTIFGVFMSYSGYSEVLTVLRETFNTHLTERLQFLRSNDPGIQEIHTHAAEVQRTSQYLSKEVWVNICDNAKVSVSRIIFTYYRVHC